MMKLSKNNLSKFPLRYRYKNLKESKDNFFVKSRFKWIVIICLTLWITIIIRLWYLQIGKGSFYENLAQKNYLRSIDIAAPRGKILDRNGNIILSNRSFYDLIMIRHFVKDPYFTFNQISQLINVSEKKLTKNYQNNLTKAKYQPIILHKNLSLHQVSMIQGAKIDLSGIDVATDIRRDYRDTPNSTSHFLGYLAPITKNQLTKLNSHHRHLNFQPNDLVGQYGLEKKWEHYLRGSKGHHFIRVDALGRRIDSNYDLMLSSQSTKPPIPGNNLIITIDIELQKIAQKAFSGKDGAIVVINAKTGEILSLVSSPSYPIDLYQSDITTDYWQQIINDPAKPLLDKTTGAQYQPGSTIKVIIALAALQKGLIDQTSTFDCPGYWQFGDKTYHCHKKNGHGKNINLQQAIAQSCNVFFYNLAIKLGIDNIHHYAQLFHLGKKLGIDLNEEKPGLIPSQQWKKLHHNSPWYQGETPIVSIGQGPILITPIQLANLYATIGNNGIIYKPYIVKQVLDSYGNILYQNVPKIISKITKNQINQDYFDLIDQALIATVEDPQGTANLAKVPKVTVAGKTGSVQISNIKRDTLGQSIISNSDNTRFQREHAIFVAYSPADDAEIAIAVISQNDQQGGGGAQSAPIAQKIIAGYWKLKNLRKQHISHNQKTLNQLKRMKFN